MQTYVEQPEFKVTSEMIVRFDNKVVITKTCHIWRGAVDRNGYGAFKLNGMKVAAHVAAWRISHDGLAVPVGKLVAHTCGCRLCVKPEHLVLGTQASIRRRSIKRNGTIHGHIFDEESIREVRQLHANGMNYSELADKYECSRKTIAGIVKRHTWKHVE